MKPSPIQIGRNLWTCAMACEHRQKRPENGVALCQLNRRDHRLNAEAGDCPEGRFKPHHEKAAPVPVRGKSLDDKRGICGSCPASGGFELSVSGREEGGLPEVVNCSSCPCPLKMVNLRTGRCPRRFW